jgi:Flp pilus assembly protein CpaB
MRAGGRILMIFGLILAVIAGVATFLVLQRSDQAEELGGEQTAAPETTTVIVAVQPIEPYQEIPIDAIQVRPYPNPVPADAILEEQATVDELTGEEVVLPGTQFVAGKISNTRIYPGQVIVATQLIDKQLEETRLGLGSNAAYIVPDGQVAVIIPASPESTIAGALRAGDQVDIIVSASIEDPGDEEGELEVVSQITLQQVQVLRVGFWSAAQADDNAGVGESNLVYLTLLVSPQQAVELKTIEQAATYEIALRSITDEAEFVTEPVDLDYLIERYNMQP